MAGERVLTVLTDKDILARGTIFRGLDDQGEEIGPYFVVEHPIVRTPEVGKPVLKYLSAVELELRLMDPVVTTRRQEITPGAKIKVLGNFNLDRK